VTARVGVEVGVRANLDPVGAQHERLLGRGARPREHDPPALLGEEPRKGDCVVVETFDEDGHGTAGSRGGAADPPRLTDVDCARIGTGRSTSTVRQRTGQSYLV
jgi:hypothetical protein